MFLILSAMDTLGLSLIGPYVTMALYPELSINKDIEQIMLYLGWSTKPDSLLITIGILLVLGFFTRAVMTIYVNYKILYFSQQQQVRIRCNLMKRYQNMQYVDYIGRNTADYINHIWSFASRYSHNVILSSLKILSEGTIAIFILLFLAVKNPIAFGLFITTIGCTLILYYKIFRSKLNKYGINFNESAKAILQSIQESFDGFKEVRILGKEKYFLKSLSNAAEKFANFYTKSQIINMSPRYIVEFLVVSFIVFLIVGSELLNLNKQALIPTLTVFGIAAVRLVPSGNILAGAFIQLRFNRDAVSRLYTDWLSLDNNQMTSFISDRTLDIKSDFQSLEIKNISFSYPNSKSFALRNISLDINPGESVGFMGPSGCGKTTLVDIILGLIQPHDGEIIYNGNPLVQSLVQWRKNIAYLPQQTFLTDSTLRNNVALGIDDDHINIPKVYESLSQAKLDEFTKNLPDGIETMIGERGVRLSGGQRQRIAIARAFYHNRNIIVMDESTSALDGNTEEEIVEEIKNFKGKKTILVIAHRLSTLKHCDRVYTLKNGRIINSGSYKDLNNSYNDNKK